MHGMMVLAATAIFQSAPSLRFGSSMSNVSSIEARSFSCTGEAPRVCCMMMSAHHIAVRMPLAFRKDASEPLGTRVRLLVATKGSHTPRLYREGLNIVEGISPVHSGCMRLRFLSSVGAFSVSRRARSIFPNKTDDRSFVGSSQLTILRSHCSG